MIATTRSPARFTEKQLWTTGVVQTHRHLTQSCHEDAILLGKLDAGQLLRILDFFAVTQWTGSRDQLAGIGFILSPPELLSSVQAKSKPPAEFEETRTILCRRFAGLLSIPV